jgi:hypothetical protein
MAVVEGKTVPDPTLTSRRPQSAFALVLMVSVLAMAVLLLITLAAVTRVETRMAANADELARARQDVTMALHVALGQLQRYAGPDARVTASAASFGGGEGTAAFTGVWDSATGAVAPMIWLVSGNEQNPLAVTPASSVASGAELVGEGTATAPRQVLVPWQELTESALDGSSAVRSRIAWWVEDRGVKASVSTPDRSAEVAYGPWQDSVQRQRLRQQLGSIPSWIEPTGTSARGFDPWAAAHRPWLERVLASGQLGWLDPIGAEPLPSALRHRWQAVTPATHGVLANTLPTDHLGRGLWRDLSLAPEALGPAFVRYQRRDYIEPPSFGNTAVPSITTEASPRRRAAVQAPISQAADAFRPAFVSSVAPVLTEVLLQFRLDRVSGGVELRSRVYVGLWNPYSVALQAPADLELVVRGLPTIRVADPLEGSAAAIDLQQSAFGPARDRVQLPFTAGESGQTDRVSWLPGRMYGWTTLTGPDPPGELAFYGKTLNASGWVGGVTPLAGSSSNLAVTGPAVTTLMVELWAGGERLTTCSAPAYPPFSIPDIEPAGASSYWNWRFAYGFRLGQPSSTSLDRSWLISDGRDPRTMDAGPELWDPFNASGGFEPDAPAYTGVPPTASGLEHLLLFRPQGTAIATRSANRDTPVFELPRLPLLSLGELQHLQVEGYRPFAVGNPWGGLANGVFDRHFFSGLEPHGAGPDISSHEPLPNWNLIPFDTRLESTPAALDLADLRAAGAFSSRLLLQRGAFNVNSVDPVAWAAVLSSSRFPANFEFAWADVDDGPLITAATGSQRSESALISESFDDPAWGSSGLAGPVFFRFSQTAQETFFSSSEAALGAGELSRRPFRQGVRGGEDAVRGLTAAQVRALAERIVGLVRVKHAASGPFRSLEEFINGSPALGGRSVLERAIAESELNRAAFSGDAAVSSPDYHGFSSLTLTSADLLTTLAPYLRNRSDTFAIRAAAEVLNPATGTVTARAWAEMTVQRFPSPVEPNDSFEQPSGRFGRRFEITGFRWLSPFEL